MKKTLFFAAVAALLCAFSCTKEVDEFVPQPQSLHKVFTAVISSPATRTSLDLSDGSIGWEYGDEITVTDALSNTAIYTCTDASAGTFEYSSGDDLVDGPYSATYGEAPAFAQTYSTTQGRLPMTAESSSEVLTFTVTCGLLRVNIKADGIAIKSVAVSDGSDTYTLTSTDPVTTSATGTPFYIAVPAGSYTAFAITDDEDRFCTKKIQEGKSFSVAANTIQGISFADPAFGPKYLCFTAEEDGSTVGMAINGTLSSVPSLEYCTDKISWNPFIIGSTIVTLTNAGDKVYFRNSGTADSFSESSKYAYFVLTGKVAASGNVMSLLDKTCQATAVPKYAFFKLFQNCSSLTKAPDLPATTLAPACYYGMFLHCSSLPEAPELPATTLDKLCYEQMFYYCTSLIEAPELLATSLSFRCYEQMFYCCTSLIEAPELPATSLAEDCYKQMFSYCTSLTKAPELPATSLANHCYEEMFKRCNDLSYVKCLATNISASSCLTNWLNGVASSGTFVKKTSMNDWPSGDSGIPSGWTVEDAN